MNIAKEKATGEADLLLKQAKASALITKLSKQKVAL